MELCLFQKWVGTGFMVCYVDAENFFNCPVSVYAEIDVRNLKLKIYDTHLPAAPPRILTGILGFAEPWKTSQLCVLDGTTKTDCYMKYSYGEDAYNLNGEICTQANSNSETKLCEFSIRKA